MTSDAHDFVHTFFKKGAEFTEELLKENEQLRARGLELETENANLRAAVASDQAMRELMRTIGELEKEKNELLSRISAIDRAAGAVSTRFSNRFAEVEDELAQLANLYIASYQLHSSLDGKRVVLHLRELLAQLVGASSFAVYWFDEAKQMLLPLICEGGHPDAPIAVGSDAEHPKADARLAKIAFASERAFLTGVASIHQGLMADAEAPVACIPLRIGDQGGRSDQIKGLVVVDGVLPQKERFLPVDFELFKMLGGHAATALAGALLFRAAGEKLPEMEPMRRDFVGTPPIITRTDGYSFAPPSVNASVNATGAPDTNDGSKR